MTMSQQTPQAREKLRGKEGGRDTESEGDPSHRDSTRSSDRRTGRPERQRTARGWRGGRLGAATSQGTCGFQGLQVPVVV